MVRRFKTPRAHAQVRVQLRRDTLCNEFEGPSPSSVETLLAQDRPQEMHEIGGGWQCGIGHGNTESYRGASMRNCRNEIGCVNDRETANRLLSIRISIAQHKTEPRFHISQINLDLAR